MGTEKNILHRVMVDVYIRVKLNNPLMGMENLSRLCATRKALVSWLN